MTGRLPRIAFFCMEFALDSRFRNYAGGLGIHAGDFLKGASEQGLPVIGIGLRWRQGFGEQFVEQGTDRLYTAYRNHAPEFLQDTGVTVRLVIKGREVRVKVWKVEAFEVDALYLLDTDLEGNDEESRWITGRLYDGFGEERVAQEMVLGIGGIRALRALNLEPEVCHFNESHALFAGLELMGDHLDGGASFQEAWSAIRHRIVFTTHTSSIPRSESHPIDRLLYLGANLRLNRAQLKRIGGDPFDMTIAALRLSRLSNAVTERHRVTARRLWHYVKERSEIIGITSGVHAETWVDTRMQALADAYDGSRRAEEALWNRHMEHKRSLLRIAEQATGIKLHEGSLLIGFMRGAASEARPGLLFSEESFLDPLLKHRRIQILMAGKSHPLDDAGKAVLEGILAKARRHPRQVVFLENGDLELGRELAQGADLWLNTSSSASGTTGMRAAMNGVLPLSVLEGWWPEACQHGINGWQFGDGFRSEEASIQDQHDFLALKRVLTDEVIPAYYERPSQWVRMMSESIRSTRPLFDAKRMLREYFDCLYAQGEASSV